MNLQFCFEDKRNKMATPSSESESEFDGFNDNDIQLAAERVRRVNQGYNTDSDISIPSTDDESSGSDSDASLLLPGGASK